MMTRNQTNNKNEYDQVATSSPRNDNNSNNNRKYSLCSIVSLVVLCLLTTLGIYFGRTYYHPQQWNSSNDAAAAAAASAGSAAAATTEDETSLYDPTLNNTTTSSNTINNDKWKEDNENSSETSTSSLLSSSTDPTTKSSSSSSFDWIEEEMSHHSVVNENKEDDNDNDYEYDNDSSVLKVHLVPHTHDDVGWLKTVEQYFYGYNNTIQHACVKCILDTTIRALAEDSRRKFTWVEISFFEMWYNDQTPQMKELVKHLVLDTKQFVFVNGGWCMHDEATTYYMGMIDQTTRGHVFLHDTFDGYTPHVGWQLDPFGHSSTQAKYMTSEMGFDSLFVGRIDHQDLDIRLETSQCEGIWEASSEKDTTIFWSKTGSYEGVYGPPNGFKFDSTFKDDYEPVVMIDDVSGNKVGNPARLEEFLDRIMWQATHTQGNHIMLTMGSDFWYENAFENYQRLDELIYWMNDFSTRGKFPSDKMGKYSHVKVFYSDPSTYTKAKYEEQQQQLQGRSSPATISYDVKTDDFFPYSSNDHSYWTGFFTSRPSLKRFERVTSGFLHAARQVEALDDLQSRSLATPASSTSPLDSLEDSVSILQHHDGVTGTSKQHVANDYVKRTYSGWRKASQYMAHKLLATMKPYLNRKRPSELFYCPLIYNESKCELTQTLTNEENASDNNGFYVVAYNALTYTRNETLRIPVMNDRIEHYQIFDFDQNLMNFTIFPNINNDLVFGLDDNNDESLMTAPYHLYVKATNLRPLQATTFFIQLLKEETKKEATKEGTTHDLRRQLLRRGKPNNKNSAYHRQLGSHHHNHNNKKNKEEEDFKTDDDSTNDDDDAHYYYNNDEVTNEEDTIDIKENEEPMAMPEQTENPLERIMNQFSIEFGYYKSYASDDKHDQNSGAYIFRPDGDFVVVEPEEPPVFYSSDFVSEIHQRVNSWIRYVIRATQGSPYIEVEYTVGPIPVSSDHIGKEVVVRYRSADLQNNGIFYTDSNGREFQKRQVSYRPTWDLGKNEHEPIAGNYYPVNSAIYIEDSEKSMAIVTDRSHGGTSLQKGTIEIMVHRRMLVDDQFGVEEALDESYSETESYPPYGKGQHHVGSGKGLIVQGTHRVYLSEVYGGATLARSGMDDMFSSISLFFGQSTSTSVTHTTNEETTTNNHNEQAEGDGDITSSISSINILPSNLMLVTFIKWPFASASNTSTTHEKSFLVRIGHQYATGEDLELSNVEYYDMTWLFGNVTSSAVNVVHMEERTLSGNQLRSTWESKRLSWIGTTSDKQPSAAAAPTIETSTACTIHTNNSTSSPSSTFLFQIQPMKICTFAVTVEIKI